jgi:hypothetical protein
LAGRPLDEVFDDGPEEILAKALPVFVLDAVVGAP